MPAEWERHEATWLGWPHHSSITLHHYSTLHFADDDNDNAK